MANRAQCLQSARFKEQFPEVQMAKGEIDDNAHSDLPTIFGPGLDSVGLNERQDVVARENLSQDKIGDTTARLHLVRSDSELTSILNLSAQAKFSGFGGHGRAKAQYARSLKTKRTEILFVLEKSVLVRRSRLISPRLTPGAVMFLENNSPVKFLEKYGDVFINRADFGASFYLTLRYDAGSVERAESLKVSLSGSYGSVSGSGDLESRVFSKLVKEEILFDAKTFGYPHVPKVGSFEGSDNASLSSILDYFDNFEEKVLAYDGALSVLSFGTLKIRDAEGAKPTVKDFDEVVEKIHTASLLKDELEVYLLDFDFALANRHLIKAGTEAAVLRDRRKVEDMLLEIDEFANRLFRNPEASAELPFEKKKFPPLPVLIDRPHIPIRVKAILATGELLEGVSGQTVGSGKIQDTHIMNLWFDIANYGMDIDLVFSFRRIWFGDGADRVIHQPSGEPREKYAVGSFISLYLTGELAKNYSVGYNVAVENYENTQRYDSGWYFDGEPISSPVEGGISAVTVILTPRDLPSDRRLVVLNSAHNRKDAAGMSRSSSFVRYGSIALGLIVAARLLRRLLDR